MLSYHDAEHGAGIGGKMQYSMKYESPLGCMTVTCSDDSILAVCLENQRYYADYFDAASADRSESPALSTAADWLDEYFRGRRPGITGLPLAPAGSRFRQTVWSILKEIPYGEVTTYGEVALEAARRLGRNHMSSQAVGGAVGHNPLAIMIPCHRVIGAGGNLTGYDGGIDKKVWLLKHEGADMTGLYVPDRGTAL